MARPNRPRSIASEADLSRRIAFEIERQGMKPATIAQRMTDIGCAINTSAIYKIISPGEGQTPRRITVDELVAFADVFGLTVTDLLAPPELAEKEALRAVFEEWAEINRTVIDLIERDTMLWQDILEMTDDRPALQELAESLLKRWGANDNRSQRWVDAHVDQVKRKGKRG